MNDIYDERVSVTALTVACPECGVEPLQRCLRTAPGSLIQYQIKERPHYARYELAVKPAVEEAVQKFAEPESKRRLVSLTSSSPANSRDPRQFTLLIEDEEANTVMAFDMDEHQFCLLMSHHVVKLEVS